MKQYGDEEIDMRSREKGPKIYQAKSAETNSNLGGGGDGIQESKLLRMA